MTSISQTVTSRRTTIISSVGPAFSNLLPVVALLGVFGLGLGCGLLPGFIHGKLSEAGLSLPHLGASMADGFMPVTPATAELRAIAAGREDELRNQMRDCLQKLMSFDFTTPGHLNPAARECLTDNARAEFVYGLKNSGSFDFVDTHKAVMQAQAGIPVTLADGIDVFTKSYMIKYGTQIDENIFLSGQTVPIRLRINATLLSTPTGFKIDRILVLNP